MRRVVDAAAESTRGILKPDLGRAMFTLSRRPAPPDLASHVECHWIVSWNLGDAESFTQELLPHPCINLSSEPGLVAVYGIPLSRSPHRIEGSGIVVGTKFRPGGFADFFERPVDELNDRIAPLDEVFGQPGARLARELADRYGDPDAHIEVVESFLRERLPPPDPRYELVSRVVAEMLVVEPGTTVAELADRYAVSQRTLQRLFREHVGVGPKWVLKRYRMHVAADRIAAGEADDHAALALDLGYFDQAHFIRDFTAQIGLSPGAYARACDAAAGREPALVGQG
jgi:AraC-like DNA-binding protein